MAPTTRATPTAAYDLLIPPLSSFSLPNPHVCAPSDDIDFSVSGAASLHPLSSADPPSSLSSSHSAKASNGSERQSNTATTITNKFLMGARRRHAVNISGLLRGSTRDEDDIFEGSDDDGSSPGGFDEVSGGGWMEISTPFPTSRGQHHHLSPLSIASDQSAGSGPLQLHKAAVDRSTYHSSKVDGHLEGPHRTLPMPPSSSVTRLSSTPPAPGHKSWFPTSLGDPAYAGLSKSAILSAALSSGSARHSRSIPDAFFMRDTPFATVKYAPPNGAPGYLGDEGWDTGRFPVDWGDEGVPGVVKNNVEVQRKNGPRVMKLVGRKEEAAGVLTRGLSDALRLHLPALARLCTTWTLLYSMDQHGVSLSTFYDLSSPSASSINKACSTPGMRWLFIDALLSSWVSGGRKGAMLVIRDTLDGEFGGWIGEGLPLHRTGEGPLDSFLWETSSAIPEPPPVTTARPGSTSLRGYLTAQARNAWRSITMYSAQKERKKTQQERAVRNRKAEPPNSS